MSTITTRGYVKREGKALVPTQLGEVTNDIMLRNFATIVDEHFTARMENDPGRDRGRQGEHGGRAEPVRNGFEKPAGAGGKQIDRSAFRCRLRRRTLFATSAEAA